MVDMGEWRLGEIGGDGKGDSFTFKYFINNTIEQEETSAILLFSF